MVSSSAGCPSRPGAGTTSIIEPFNDLSSLRNNGLGRRPARGGPWYRQRRVNSGLIGLQCGNGTSRKTLVCDSAAADQWRGSGRFGLHRSVKQLRFRILRGLAARPGKSSVTTQMVLKPLLRAVTMPKMPRCTIAVFQGLDRPRHHSFPAGRKLGSHFAHDLTPC